MTDEEREILKDLVAVMNGELDDRTDCPYFKGDGLCNRGCQSEPACETCEPNEGWPLDRARQLIAEWEPTTEEQS